MNVLFVQTGHYAEAYARLKTGGEETYRDQRASVDWVESLSQSCSVTVLSISGETYDDIQLSPTLRSVNVSYETADELWFRNFFDETSPDKIICRLPHLAVLRLAKRYNIPTLANFADFFVNSSLRQVYWHLRLRLALTGPHLPCISNHSRNASLSVNRALFYPKARVVPWDRLVIDAGYDVKTRPADDAVLRVFYAGVLTESKGLGDLLKAVAYSVSQGGSLELTIAGEGDEADWRARAKSLAIGGRTTFLGKIPNESVMDYMNAHDVVVVPSRKDYGEGLPNTIREALAARTPVITSDHPAFAGRLVQDQECLVFPERDHVALAQALMRLKDDAHLYETLSGNSAEAAQRLKFGLYWGELWDLFLKDPASQTHWVQKNSLVSLGL